PVPCDVRLGKMMVKAASFLLVSGIGAPYAYAEREELSVLVSPTGSMLESEEHASLSETLAVDELRDARELLIRLVSEASSKLSLLAGVPVRLDGRLYEFPNTQIALEYFRWRQEQARLGALDRYCAYVLQKTGGSENDPLKVLEGMAEDEKIEIL